MRKTMRTLGFTVVFGSALVIGCADEPENMLGPSVAVAPDVNDALIGDTVRAIVLTVQVPAKYLNQVVGSRVRNGRLVRDGVVLGTRMRTPHVEQRYPRN